jgi:hypothetical protein
MTGAEFKTVREGLCLSPTEFGRLLGYQSGPYKAVARFEAGSRRIPPRMARLVYLLSVRSGLPNWPANIDGEVK